MTTAWNRVEDLRRANPGATSVGSPELAALLGELAAGGDLDAAIQLALDRITADLGAGRITLCEAFVRALEAIYRLVAQASRVPVPVSTPTPLPGGGVVPPPTQAEHAQGTPETKRAFLSYAWTYLVAESDQDGGHMVLTDRFRVGGYEHAAPAWTNRHTPQDAPSGSGWYAPLPGDRAPTEARSARHAHFLANALLAADYGLAAQAARLLPEASSTDKLTNELGQAFGAALASGQVDLRNLADWLRNRLCTESWDVHVGWVETSGEYYPPGFFGSRYQVKVTVTYRGVVLGERSRKVELPGGHTHYGCRGGKSVRVKAGEAESIDALVDKAIDEALGRP
jgi:hypothetical protein